MTEGTHEDYYERYCAFVDILGFASLIESVSGERVHFLKELLQTLHTPWTARGTHKGASFRAQSISDAIALSAAVNGPGLRHILASLRSLTLDLLKLGYFVRGALVKGRLYHDDRMVFGEALLNAIRLEREIVRFPRIMITSTIAQEIQQDEEKYGERVIVQGNDGPYHLHVLRDLSSLPLGRVDTFITIRNQIQRRFDEAVDNPRHFEKVQWFANYWNAFMPDGIPGLEPIKGPGLNVVRWLRT
jgi:hypothetical protein